MGTLILCAFLIVGCIVVKIIADKLKKENLEDIEKYQKVIANPEADKYEKREAEKGIESSKAATTKVKTISNCIVVAIATAVVLLLVFSNVTMIPTGYTGIKVTFGQVDNNTLDAGLKPKLPWQDVVLMDNREQKHPFTLEAFSSDIQQVDIRCSININIDKTTAMNLYKDVGTSYVDILVLPRVQEDVKVVIASYNAENLISNRERASKQIFEKLKEELSLKGINVISFAIENIDFTDAFEGAVEAKQVATQEKQRAQTEQEKATMEETQKAERKRITAEAEADVKKTQADASAYADKVKADADAYAVRVKAEAQAEANREIAATLSEALIKYNTIEQWNGKLPSVMSGEGMTSIIDLRSVMDTEVQLVGDDDGKDV